MHRTRQLNAVPAPGYFSSLPVVVGLGHYAQTGKDTIAEQLVARHGFIRLSFADVIRNLTWELFPTIGKYVSELGYEEAKAISPDVRDSLILVGNACKKHLWPSVFIDALDRQLESGKRYVIADLRAPDEVNWIHSRGGWCIKVTRPGYEPLDNEADQWLANFDGWDAVVDNDGDLVDLRAKADYIVGMTTTGPRSAKSRAISRIEPFT